MQPAHFHPDDLRADFETRSRIDLKSAGARRYASDPSTNVTTVVWKFRNVLKTACTVHPHIGTHTLADLYADVRLCRRFVAHHANFDVSILHAKNPFNKIPLEKIDCTMARAQALALPGGLDQVCTVLGVKGKDPRGRALVMATCKPRKDGTFNEDLQTYKELLAYNVQDVHALESIDARLPPLSPEERLIFERTWRKNDLGLPIDIHLATAIAMRRQEIESETAQKISELTNGSVTKLSQRQRILDWCNSGNRTAGLESTQKHIIAEKLADDDLHPDVRELLEILQAEGGSAPLKAQALLDRHVGSWYKDATRYFGTRSGRGTSEGANMFNIARPSGKFDTEEVIARLKAGFKYGNVALTDALRGCVVAPQGYMIMDNDLANAELRLALWQAGDTERLRILESGGDLYMHNGILLFNLPQGATKSTYPKERQTAKNVTLGGNYQLGWKTYMSFLFKTAAENGLKRSDITEYKARGDIDGYRKANPKLVKLWHDLADAFKFAIYEPPGRLFPAGKIAFQKDGNGTVWMLLPSGRAIPHYNAHVTHEGEMAFFRGKFGAMLRQKAFGGSLLEISCFAGDTCVLSRTGIKRIDAVTPHDEIWDGAEWVKQKGSILRGSKPVIEVCGTRVTPDHLILCSEQDDTQTWQSVGGLSPSQLKSAIALAASSLPAGFRASKVAAKEWTSWSDATAALRKRLSVAVIFVTQNSRAAPFALAKRLLAFGRRVAGDIWLLTINSGLKYLAPSAEPSHAVRTSPTSITAATAVAGSGSTNLGSPTGARIWNTSSRFRALTTRILSWIGSITTGAMSPETYAFQTGVRKRSTAGTSKTLKPSELVYDLLDCGPRNRFMICTPTGHFLLAHNCQSMTRDIVTASEEDIENELPDVHLILDVYDSILGLAPVAIAAQRSEQIREIMRRPRFWTAGLPLGCEGYEATRMKK